MVPVPALLDEKDGLGRNAVIQTDHSIWARVIPDGLDHVCSDFGIRMPVTKRQAAVSFALQHILAVRSFAEVVGIYAKCIMAMMATLHPFPDRTPELYRKRNAVNADKITVNPHSGVSSSRWNKRRFNAARAIVKASGLLTEALNDGAVLLWHTVVIYVDSRFVYRATRHVAAN